MANVNNTHSHFFLPWCRETFANSTGSRGSPVVEIVHEVANISDLVDASTKHWTAFAITKFRSLSLSLSLSLNLSLSISFSVFHSPYA
jgi:hypothetical protein